MSQNIYDVVIIGSGPAGMFTALELVKLNPRLKMAICEKGPIRPAQKPEDRKILTQGWGGAGAFSDGKLGLTGYTGGQLQTILGVNQFKELMNYVDAVYREFGGEKKLVDPNLSEIQPFVRRLQREAFDLAGLDVVPVPIRHFGTDGAYTIVENIRKHLESKGVDIFVRTPIKEIHPRKNDFELRGFEGKSFESRKVVVAPGRSGSEWFLREIRRLNIPFKIGSVDVGLRIEVRAESLKKLTDVFHEFKIYYRTKKRNDRVRTFCVCPYGFVTVEDYHGLTVVNGHSYEGRKSENTNFAILVTQDFTEPFNDPIAYGQSIAASVNQLAGGGVLVQRLVDFKNGRRSKEKHIPGWLVQPTLKEAVPGNIGLSGMPMWHLEAVIEMIEALDLVLKNMGIGGINSHSLLYAPEIKFYSVQIETNKAFETSIPGFYVAGDGSGYTRGLMQASMMGVIVARNIVSVLSPGSIQSKSKS